MSTQTLAATATLATTARDLDQRLINAAPADIVAAAAQSVAPGRLAVVSSFGAETAALLKLVADVDRTLPVLFLDTGWLFEETLAYRDVLVATFGLTDLRIFTPPPKTLAKHDPDGDLWAHNPDLCCQIRKVIPLAEALQPFDGWINGRKRYHGFERERLPVVESDGARLKFNPLAHASRQDIERIFADHVLPHHPLEAHGFSSIGCMPCTHRTRPDEDPRAGRWRGQAKTECGIHTMAMPAAPPDSGAGDGTAPPTAAAEPVPHAR